jgi:hypothetical protein
VRGYSEVEAMALSGGRSSMMNVDDRMDRGDGRDLQKLGDGRKEV